jgi:hypothetical protein
LRWGAVAAFALLIAPPTFAYTGASLEWLHFPQLAVASDGDHYTVVTGIGYAWEGRVAIESEGLPRVKSWSLYPILHVEGLESLSFKPYAAGKSYPIGKRPQDVHRTVGTIFPNIFVNEYAAAACNLHLERLMSQGQSRAQVLSQQRTVAADLGWGLDLDITVGDPIIEASAPMQVDIVCEKSPAKGVKPGASGVTTTGDFELDNARLTIFPDTWSGACPKDLTLFMEVQGNHTGTFEARIESTAGWKSTKTVLQTNEFDDNSGLWTREFSDPFSVPVKMPTPGGGGGGIEPAAGDFQVQQNPGDDVPIGPSTPQAAGGGFAAADPGSNVHQQSLRLVATANGKTVASPWKQYRVTCDPKPAIPPATQQFLPGGTGGKPPKPTRPTEPTPNAPQPTQPAPGAKPNPKQPTGAKSGPEASTQPKAKASQPAPTRRPAAPTKPPKTAPNAATTASSPGKPAAPAGVAPTAQKTTNAQPDLRVVRARRNAKKPATIEFLVENRGRGAAPKSSALLTCGRADGGAESWSAPVPALAASSQRWIATTPQRAQPARTPVRGCEIRVDQADLVQESDEGNNRFTCADCVAAKSSNR